MEVKKKLAILDMYDGTPNQGMRCIREIVERFSDQIDYSIYDVRGKGQVPGMNYDIYISTGGPGNPLDGDGDWDVSYYTWMQSVWDWNEENEEAKKHVFFICHSFQMACHHFRIGDITERSTMSFGTFPVHKTDAGYRESLFENLPNPFFVADFRRFQVIKPNEKQIDALGAEILALEKIRPYVPFERAIMGVRFSPEIIGVQFHPEADPEGMLAYFSDPKKREEVIENHGEEKLNQMISDLKDQSKLNKTHDVVLPMFISRALEHMQVYSYA